MQASGYEGGVASDLGGHEPIIDEYGQGDNDKLDK
jgi:hypothetical protein